MQILWAVRGIYPVELGGAQKHSYELMRALARRGAQIDLLHPYPHEIFPDESWIRKELPMGISIRSFFHLLGYSLKAKKYLFDNILTDYDVCYSDGIVLIFYTQKVSAPCFFNPHGMPNLQGSKQFFNPKKLLDKFFNMKMAKWSNRVISLGGKLTDIITSELFTAPDRIIKIPNGIASDTITTHPARQPEKATNFLFVGTLNEHKGVEQLLSAANRREFRDCTFRIIGGGPLESKLRTTANYDNIHFMGSIKDPHEIRQWYDSSHCLLLPSLRDGMPTVILEGMARGLPIIATKVGAVTEMVTDRENGFICQPGDSHAFASAMNRFRNLSQSQRMLLAETSLKRVQKFTWDRIAGEFLIQAQKVASEKNL